jgi:heat shock protein HslJ
MFRIRHQKWSDGRMSLPRLLGLSTLALTVVLAVAGCAGGPGSDGETDGGADAAPTGTWRDGTAWLTLDDGKVTGNDGCNSVYGTYSTAGDTVRFTLDPTTLKMCLGVTLSFARIASAIVSDDELTLLGPDDAAITTLARDAG